MAIELNENNFNTETAEGRVLVDFWAVWCGPCRAQAPILDKLDHTKVKVCKVNVDDYPALAQRFGVVSIPTLVVFENGKLVKKAAGLHSLEQLNALIGI
ncbi:MAG: thioredoxin [Firmicutes bacterium]|nr:thioredoxin [Bacillota bacterium]